MSHETHAASFGSSDARQASRLGPRLTRFGAILLLACVLSPGVARAELPPNRLSAQVGWWAAEAEVELFFGLYLAGGVSWGSLVVDRALGDQTGVPVEWAAGYRYRMDNGLSLGGGVRSMFFTGEPEPPALEFSEVYPDGYAGLGISGTALELGLRYHWPMGLIAGVNLPLALIGSPDGMNSGAFGPSYTLRLSQAYVGWALDW